MCIGTGFIVCNENLSEYHLVTVYLITYSRVVVF